MAAISRVLQRWKSKRRVEFRACCTWSASLKENWERRVARVRGSVEFARFLPTQDLGPSANGMYLLGRSAATQQ